MRGLSIAVCAICAVLGACTNKPDAPPELPVTPWVPAAVAHAGNGTPPERGVKTCREAVDAALGVIEGGGDVLDAAVAGIEVLEDNPQLNAGIGSRVRLDGETVQMDASLMRSDGRFGAVGVVEDVRHPIEVARAVLDTPHLVMAGEGATRFAHAIGIEPFDPATEERKKQIVELRQRLIDKDPRYKEWNDYDWVRAWNFEKTIEELGIDVGHDTVGVIVRDANGNFAAALSTGGTSIMLRGRVGDVAVYGAGLWAGEWGAVAATGRGERIIEELTGRTTHDLIAEGKSAQQAADHAVERIKGRGSIGLIVLSPTEMAAASDRNFAWAGRESGSKAWHGPKPE